MFTFDYSKSAAGALHQLSSTVSPKLLSSVSDATSVLEFTGAFIESLESLMLAQAQEGVWQKAVLGMCSVTRADAHGRLNRTIDNYKNGIIAKLAAKVAIPP